MKSDMRGLKGFEFLMVVLTCLTVQAVFTLAAYGDRIVGWESNTWDEATLLGGPHSPMKYHLLQATCPPRRNDATLPATRTNRPPILPSQKVDRDSCPLDRRTTLTLPFVIGNNGIVCSLMNKAGSSYALK